MLEADTRVPLTALARFAKIYRTCGVSAYSGKSEKTEAAMADHKGEQMTWIQEYAEKRSAKDPEFKASHEEEAALLGLVRARQTANMTQQNLATLLRVSQPYIAQIERGSKPISLSLMVRYANAVGATIQIAPRNDNPVTA